MRLHLSTPPVDVEKLVPERRLAPQSASSFGSLRAVLFAVDGTLVDSNDAHAWAWVEALRKYKLPAPFHLVRPLIGVSAEKMVRDLTGIEEKNPVGRLIRETRAAVFSNGYMLSVRPMPSARDLLERMRDDGIQIAATSFASPGDLERMLEVASVDDLVDERITTEATGGSPLDRDLVRLAIKRLRVPPADLAIVGDTPYDLAAAADGDLPFIGMRCGGWSDCWLAGAIALYDDPADLLARYDESPLAVGATRGR